MRIDHGNTRAGYYDGIPRRRAIRAGGAGFLAGLGLPQWLQLQAEAAAPVPGKAKSCIFIFLEGGPSTIDMWDLKPAAPAEIRGPYQPIATAVPGTFVGEHLPLCAQVADKFTILRSHSHADNGHKTGYHYVMTGYKSSLPDGDTIPIPNNILFPSIGSIISRELGARGSLPPYINLPDPMTAGGPGFYGAEYAPFVIESDPVAPDFEVKDLAAAGTAPSRIEARRRLLAGIETLQQGNARVGRSEVMSTYYKKANELVNSPAAKAAFDIAAEGEPMRARYGYTSLGQCSLLARRLVEAGCRFVGIDHGSWDTHFDCFPSQEKDLFPHADRAFSALVSDLDQRGLLDSTLVVMMGEMGRTPRINGRAGRDHWSQAQSVLFAGAGIKRGAVVGATDAQAAFPTSDPVGVEDLLRTIMHLVGIDSTKIYYTPLGRPVPIVNGGEVVTKLLV